MFIKWFDVDIGASWGVLISAIDKLSDCKCLFFVYVSFLINYLISEINFKRNTNASSKAHAFTSRLKKIEVLCNRMNGW